MSQDYAAKAKTQSIYAGIWFKNHMKSDFLPDEVKGAGPNSKAHRDYANQTHGKVV